MGNAPSSIPRAKASTGVNRNRNRRRQPSGKPPPTWQIPLERNKLPVLRAGKTRHRRELYRRPSLTTWHNDNADNNDSPVTWAEVRRYLLRGPVP